MAYPNFEKEINETRRRVLDYLKPFQRETVLHIDRLFSRGIRRVLVADSVSENLVDRVKGPNRALACSTFSHTSTQRKAKRDGNFIQLIPLTPETSFNVTGDREPSTNGRSFCNLKTPRSFCRPSERVGGASHLRCHAKLALLEAALRRACCWARAAYLSDMQKRLKRAQSSSGS